RIELRQRLFLHVLDNGFLLPPEVGRLGHLRRGFRLRFRYRLLEHLLGRHGRFDGGRGRRFALRGTGEGQQVLVVNLRRRPTRRGRRRVLGPVLGGVHEAGLFVVRGRRFLRRGFRLDAEAGVHVARIVGRAPLGGRRLGHFAGKQLLRQQRFGL